jgi:hypothetical protein
MPAFCQVKEIDYDVVYNENTIPEYDLPDLLITVTGDTVTNAEQWENVRRPQILSLFGNLIYGQIPLTHAEFNQTMPGLLAMFAKEGCMMLVWGILLLPIGFGIQAIALIRSKAMPRWQGILILVGVPFVGTPVCVEIVNLTAALLLAAAFVPYGIQLIARAQSDAHIRLRFSLPANTIL